MSRFGKPNITTPPLSGWKPGTGNVLQSRVIQRFDHYEVREEIIRTGDRPEDRERMVAAYTHDGHYIGAPDDAKYICHSKGIRPERAADDHSTCTIGYSAKDGSWYGWGERSIRCFPSSGDDSAARQGAIDFAVSVR